MPRCYMVKKTGGGSIKNDGLWGAAAPGSPSEAAVAPPCYTPLGTQSAFSDSRANKAESEETMYAAWPQRSAADTEAAHDLLSLAQSLPPLPPATVVTPHPDSPPPSSPRLLLSCPLRASAHHLIILSDEPLSADCEPPLELAEVPHVVEYVTLEAEAEEEAEAEVGAAGEAAGGGEERSPAAGVHARAPAERRGRFVCVECGRRYATSSNLSRHRQIHRSLDSGLAKRCGQCGKAYVSMPALAMHMLTHQLAHECGVCGKLFSRPWLLQGHLRSHTGEKPYGCAHCGKAFADRSNLRAHMQTHSSDKNFECARCHKTFALKSYLNKHQESACVRDDDADAEADEFELELQPN